MRLLCGSELGHESRMGEREPTGPWRPPPCPLSIVPLGALSCSANMIATALPQTHTHTKPVYQAGPSFPSSPRAGRFWQSPLGYCWEGYGGEGFSPPSCSLVTMVTMGNCWRLPATCWAVWMPRARQGPMVQAYGPWAAAFVSSRRGGGRCSPSHPGLCKQRALGQGLRATGQGTLPQSLEGMRWHLLPGSCRAPGL